MTELALRYERVRNAVRSHATPQQLSRKLEHWTRPTDRYFPRNLLSRSLENIVSRSYPELSAIPGVGRRKVQCLCQILERVVRTRSRRKPSPPHPVESEAPDWETVRAAILKLDLCDDPIGRYAPTLLSLPVNRWEEPLRKYAELAYTELNSLPSFGKGKVGSIQQVFFSIYGLLDERQQSEHLSVTIRPRFVSEVERWIHQILTGTELPSVQTIRRRFLKPIFDQIEVDGREDLRRIGELRLGPPSRILDELGREFGVTRERARQRLVEIAMILKVRWPEGEYLLDDLSDRVAWLSPGGQQSARIDAAYELFYPVRRTRRFTSSRGHAPRDDGPSEGKERTSPRNHEGESVLPLRRSRRASSGSSSQ